MKAKRQMGAVEQTTNDSAPSFTPFFIVLEQPIYETKDDETESRASVPGMIIAFKTLKEAELFVNRALATNPESGPLYIAQTTKQFWLGSRPIVVSDAMELAQAGL